MLKKIATLGIAALALGSTAPLLAQETSFPDVRPADTERPPASAGTYSPDDETVIGGRGVWLPSFPPTPSDYALPMEISIVEDSSITTDTPITDAAGSDVVRWSELISECLQQSPVMVRETVEGDVMFNVTDEDPTIVLNSNGKAVCAY